MNMNLKSDNQKILLEGNQGLKKLEKEFQNKQEINENVKTEMALLQAGINRLHWPWLHGATCLKSYPMRPKICWILIKDEIKSIKLYNKKYNEAIETCNKKAKSLEEQLQLLKAYSVSDEKIETQTQIEEKTENEKQLIAKSSKMTDEIENAEDWES